MTKHELDKMLEESGTTLDIEKIRPMGYDATIWSPPGKIFNSSGCHCCVVCMYTSNGIEGIYDMIASEIAAGFQECDDEECARCHPEAVD